MNMSFLEKVSPLSGIVAVALIVAGMVIIRPTDYFPSPERAAEIFTTNPAQIQRGALLGGFYSVVFLLWFTASVSKSMEDGAQASFVPGFVLSGGIVLAVAFMAANGLFWVAAGRASRGGMSPETAVIFYDLIQIFLSNVISVGLAVLIGATGIGALQTQALPVWLGWISIVMAIGLLTPYHYIFEGLGVLWIVVVSVLLFLGSGS